MYHLCDVSVNKRYVIFCYVTNFKGFDILCTRYIMVCPPVRGDNQRPLASGSNLEQADKPWSSILLGVLRYKI